MASVDDEAVIRDFSQRYGVSNPRLFYAPGRINLIGEHTDYNEGFVLPFAIDRGTTVAAHERNDRVVRAYSVNCDESIQFDLDLDAPPRRGHWSTYVEGMARALEDRGYILSGVDLLIASQLPLGGGLSSSAALEVSAGLAMCGVAGHSPDALTIVKTAHATETEYVGTQAGVMDPFVSVFARRDCCLFIDCRSLRFRLIPLSDENFSIVICDSGIRHSLASSEYNRRRKECEEGVALLRQYLPRVQALRDVDVNEFVQVQNKLPEPIRNRCRHVVFENARTQQAADALTANDFVTMGRLMFESYESLRRDYEVSIRELDLLVDTARHLKGVVGSRMTGGGFGGCTITLIETGAIDAFVDGIGATYSRAFGVYPRVLTARPSDGAHERIPEAPPRPPGLP